MLLVLLLLAALSGALLTIRAPLDAALNPDLFRVPAAPGTPLQSPAGLADMIQQRMPQLYVVMTPLQARAGHALVMEVAPRGPGQVLSFNQLFVDPSDGHIIGTRMNRPGWGPRHILQGVLVFHSNLLLGPLGRWVMGLVAIGWLLLAICGGGLSLSSPASGALQQGFWFRCHRTGGRWLLPGFLVLALTSVEISFYDAVFLPVTQALWQPETTPLDPGARHVSADHHTPLTYAITARWAGLQIAHEHTGWLPAYGRYFPTLGLYGISFVPTSLDTYAALGPVTFYYDDRNGRMICRDDPYRDGVRGVVMRSLYPLHSGRIGGGLTRFLVLLLGLCTAMLSVTGLYLWMRRHR